MDYTFDFHSVLSNTDVLIDGLLVTLELTIAANLVGLVLGFGVALLCGPTVAVPPAEAPAEPRELELPAEQAATAAAESSTAAMAAQARLAER